MGYDLHITRKDDWWDEDGPVITLDKWLAVVEADPDLRLDGFAEMILPDGATLRMDDPSLTVWTVPAEPVWFRHVEDRIICKNPDDEIIAKMVQLAAQLGGNVQGEEGERYDGSTPPEAGPPDAATPKKRRWFGRS